MLDPGLSVEDQVVLLLCSRLALQADDWVHPFTLPEWNPLVERIASSPLRKPGALLGLDAAAIAKRAKITHAEAERIARLLDRAPQLRIEIERLADLGIRVFTRASGDFPMRLRARLGAATPPVLFCSGKPHLCDAPTLAIVGSREVDEAAVAFTARASRWAATGKVGIISGAARGVDAVAMSKALDAGGRVVGVLAGSLERAIRTAYIRRAIADGRLLLLTPYHPAVPYSVGSATGRNRLVYSLADWALVVAATLDKGATWAGALEALGTGWTPVLVRTSADAPEGNGALLARGALPFPPEFEEHSDIVACLREISRVRQSAGDVPSRSAPSPVTDKAVHRDIGAKTDGASRLSWASNRPPELPLDWTTPHHGNPFSPRMRGEDSTPGEHRPDLAHDSSKQPALTADWEAFLELPRTDIEVAEHLGISRAHTRELLTTLVQLGTLRRIEHPVRYQLLPLSL